MDLSARFVRAVRAALGLDPDPDKGPRIDRLALYRAEVKACALDGKTVDVQPEDKRLEPHQLVPVRAGVPGAVAVVSPGAVVLLGWEKGDPSKPYAVPAWESATPTKLVLNAADIYLAEEAGSQAAGKGQTLQDWVTEIRSKFNAHTHVVPGVQAGAGSANANPPIVAEQILDKGDVRASKVKVK